MYNKVYILEMIYQINIPANPNISEIGTNGRKYLKIRTFLKFLYITRDKF